MPVNFPTMDSLMARASVRGFRQPIEGETESTFRNLFADFMLEVDPIESSEIRTGLAWDTQSPEQMLINVEVMSKLSDANLLPDNKEFIHVDEFIECGTANYRESPTLSDDDEEIEEYARWILHHFRLPAFLKLTFYSAMKEHKLFCEYDGKPYRLIGASRLGDVWLVADVTKENGYDLRIDVSKCSKWSKEPLKMMTGETELTTTETPSSCNCGGPTFGFDCTCDYVKNNPGTLNFNCEFCGLYTASKARCNKCNIG